MAFSHAHDIFPMKHFWKLLLPHCSQHKWWSIKTLKYHKNSKRKRRRGLSRKCIFHEQIQAAITGFQTFYWSGRTTSPQLIQ